MGTAVQGVVIDADTDEPLPGVMVRAEGVGTGVVTDSLGRYRLAGLPPGPQVLRAERIGYVAARVALTLPAAGVVHRDLQLTVRALAMRDITVTADAAGRATGELGTASVIERDAIEHLSATSLADVLQLAPGVSTKPPGLDDVEQVALRFSPTSSSLFALSSDAGTERSAAELAAFGTLIVLDGVPLSNNANLQTLGPRGELSFTTSASGGVDLRRIPAATIERVEVIRGVPSVRWGDLTQGAVVVDTRAAPVPPVVAANFDARTFEASALGGVSLGGRRHAATFTLDVASTQSQPAVTEDRSTRVAAQAAHRAAFGPTASSSDRRARWILDTRVDFFHLTDDRPEDPDVRPGRAFRSREGGVRLSERARVRLGPALDLSFTSALSLVRQRSTSRAPKVAGFQPFTGRPTEGREEGFYIGGNYEAQVEVDGEPGLFFARLEAENERWWLGASHRLRAGTVLRREWNSGSGLQFDVARPPQVSFNGVRGYDRPRSFDRTPPVVTSGVYLDDRLRTEVAGLPFNLQAGLRADVLHDGSSWTGGARDLLLQPRAYAELLPVPWLRVRGGWGRTAKSPAMHDLFPPPQYFDVVNVNFAAADPAERLAVLTTFIEDPANPELGFSAGRKAEFGLEVGSGDGTLSLVAFRDAVDGAVRIVGEPRFLLRDRFDLRDTPGDGRPPEVIEPPADTDTIPVLVDRPRNVFDLVSEGFELTGSFPELRPLDTRLQVTASWVRSERRSDARFYGTRRAFDAFQATASDLRTPYWEGLTETGERAFALYRLVHHRPELGLVITATVQHDVTESFRDQAGTDTLAFAGYLTRDARVVPVPRSSRSRPEFRDLRVPRRDLREIPRSAPATWMANLQVSKTLPLQGRLNFWAFNFLDRRGVRAETDRLPRTYAPFRFGFDVSFDTGGGR